MIFPVRGQGFPGPYRFQGLLLLVAAVLAIFAAVRPLTAHAACGSCLCEQWDTVVTRGVIWQQHYLTREHINKEFTKHQLYLVDDFYKKFVDPALKMMTEQLVVNGMNQMMALGAIMDAQSHAQALRLFTQHAAEAHNDYRPSTDMCVWGTAAMHMTGASTRTGLTAQVLTRRSINRQLGTINYAGQEDDTDALARIERVRILYCNPNDNLGQMQYICGAGGPINRRNRDVDFSRVMGAMTLNADFSTAAATPDEEDLFALSNYLYVNHPFTKINRETMGTIGGKETWMDVRAVTAKHLLAENSFNNIMSLKSASPAASGATAGYLAAVFTRMGVAAGDAATLIGANPSYYAMLQILSQSIYQTPSFYANLYDTPVNVRRKDAAMQAINLMVGRDTYISELREEALLSQILEMEVVKSEETLAGVIQNLTPDEKDNP